MMFKTTSNDEIMQISSANQKDRVVFVFIENVDFQAQLLLATNTNLRNILKVIHMCGGVVRRGDLVSIIYKGDKNIYSDIKKLKEYKLIKLEGERDSNIFLTATAISILEGRKIKNGIPFSKATTDVLDKSEFMLRIYNNDNFLLLNNKDALQYVTETRFETLASIEYSDLLKARGIVLDQYKKMTSINSYILNVGSSIAIYATSKNEFLRKFKTSVAVVDELKNVLDLNISKIIIPNKEDLGNFHKNELISFYKEGIKSGIDFKNIEVVSAIDLC